MHDTQRLASRSRHITDISCPVELLGCDVYAHRNCDQQGEVKPLSDAAKVADKEGEGQVSFAGGWVSMATKERSVMGSQARSTAGQGVRSRFQETKDFGGMPRRIDADTAGALARTSASCVAKHSWRATRRFWLTRILWAEIGYLRPALNLWFSAMRGWMIDLGGSPM